jgi:nucleoside-diphosphate-sugar epimerase
LKPLNKTLHYPRVVVFGGAGFIGSHLADHLLSHGIAGEVIIADLNPPRRRPYWPAVGDGLKNGRVKYVYCDVRNVIDIDALGDQADLLINLAAVHREPGHAAAEYFETNIAGARNVCEYADRIDCKKIVFTSSIAPYGPVTEQATETSLTVPDTPYGSSKLVAETVHQGWVQNDVNRNLLIIRPGVVFGPGEGGNVTRLVHAVKKGYFVYLGNAGVKKAGGYVRELCHVLEFALGLQAQSTGHSFLLINFSINPTPSLQDFVNAIKHVVDRNSRTFSIPHWMLLAASYPATALSVSVRINQPLNPIRIKKLLRSNDIAAQALVTLGYKPKYTLVSAFEDWARLRPHDFK